MPRLTLLYQRLCPNCGGVISEDRLELGLPCTKCMSEAPTPIPEDFVHRVLAIGEALRVRGALQGYWDVYDSVKRLKDFEEFFRRVTNGKRLWSAQRSWAKRLLSGESLAIVAPTGVGKTTLLAAYSIYRVVEGGARVYYLVPTENLVTQVASKLRCMASSLGKEIQVVPYCSAMSLRARREALERIGSKCYEVLVTTANFLARRWDLLEGSRFDLVIVDDVDAILKNSKNVDRLLMLLGFDEGLIKNAYRLVIAKIEAMRAKAQGNLEKYEQMLNRIREYEAQISEALSRTRSGQLVVASATGRAHGLKPKVFRELLGFEIGRVCDYIRSVTNVYKVVDDVLAECVKVVEKLVESGATGIVFVPKHLGREGAKALAAALNDRGVRAAVAASSYKALDRFASGSLDVLVGVATYYGVVVRGIDLPERVLFTVFAGAPINRLPADKAFLSPRRLVSTAVELGVEGGWEAAKALARLSPQEYTVLRIALSKGEPAEGRVGRVLELLQELYYRVLDAVESALRSENLIRLSHALIVREGGRILYVTPDAATYLQASGRASRMYGSTMTHGLSIVLDSQYEIIDLLARKLRAYLGEVEFKAFDEALIEDEVRKAKKTRKVGGRNVNVETCLIVVESPTKAKTIASFFGRPAKRRLGSLVVYETTFYNPVNAKVYVAQITATRGHIFDLTVDDVGVFGVVVNGGEFRPVYTTIKTCLNCGHQFASSESTCIRCGSKNIVDKVGVVDGLRRLASEVEVVYVATDPDVEGEKIAYDVYLALRAYARRVLRIELHEITKEELFRALASPREIDKRLVHAQVVRRIEDRWIGFGLSRLLWERLRAPWLGAGRVQTPVLGWIIRRYDEWLKSRGYAVKITLPSGIRIRFFTRTRDEALELKDSIEKHGLRVVKLDKFMVKTCPPPPYTTDTLIQDCSRLLGLTSVDAMKIAQQLYESGLITYHRTDCTYVSQSGIAIAKAYLEQLGMLEYFKPRTWGEQGHHEAIRPTKPWDREELLRKIALGELKLATQLGSKHLKVYDLILRRFVASQMSCVEVHKVEAVVEVYGHPRFRATLEFIASEPKGYLKLYPTMPISSELYRELEKGVVFPQAVSVIRSSQVKLYDHGELIAQMRLKGIGRPSTYARTIEVLKRHGYVVESKRRKYLIPTRLGRKVYEVVTAEYPDLVSEERTRRLLAKIDAISTGRLEASELLCELHAELESLLALCGKPKLSVETSKAVPAESL